MKILHVAPIGHHLEGIGTVVINLYREQISRGDKVAIISVYENQVYENVPISCIRSPFAFWRYISAFNPDVVEFHSLFSTEYALFFRLLRIKHIPYIIHMHGAFSKVNAAKNKIKKDFALLLYIKRFIKSAQAILFLNENEKNNCVLTHLNESRYIVPNGCIQLDYREKEIADIITITYVGKIDVVGKGLDLLIPAIKKVADSYANVVLNLYGTGDEGEITRLMSMIGSCSYVNYCGGIWGEAKNEVFRNTDIFVLTSRSEGMPMGVLEALSYGIPCLVTKETNVADVIDSHKAGWSCLTVHESVTSAFINALKEYCNNSSVYRKNAYTLSGEYSWDRIAAMIEDIIRKL